jgi:oxygen-independent coproporphyrinogen-3 oxidase
MEDLEDDLDQALALGPEHLSCYNLTAEPATRFGREVRAGRHALPGEETQARMFTRIGQRLEGAGLRRYEISNFARPGFESIHNRRYWRRESYLGIGTGAHSLLAVPDGGTRWWNVRDHRRYIALAREGKSCVEGSEGLGPEDARREWVFLRLRDVEGFGGSEFRGTFGKDPGEFFPGLIPALLEEGLLEATGDRVALTERGRLLSDAVFLRFF